MTPTVERIVAVMRRIVSLRGLGLVVSLGLAPAGCRLHTEEPPIATDVSAPDFRLVAHDGRTVSLADLVARGPAILVFYRGHW